MGREGGRGGQTRFFPGDFLCIGTSLRYLDPSGPPNALNMWSTIFTKGFQPGG